MVFPVNVRKSAKGGPSNAFTVHHGPECSVVKEGRSPELWADAPSLERLAALADRIKLGACSHCWGDEKDALNKRWQQAWGSDPAKQQMDEKQARELISA